MRREDNAPRRADSTDVARRAGVSRSTVSKVLNGREIDRIPSDTRQRVLQAARELNYVRNNRAHALVTGRTQRIGVALSNPDGFRRQIDYHRTVLAGIFSGAVECDYNLLFHAAHHSDWQSLYRDIIGGSADGVLLVGNYPDEELAPALIEAGFPTVFLSHMPIVPDAESPLPYHVIDCDNIQGGRLAVAHLLALGHRDIMLTVGNAPDRITDWERDRLQGVRMVLQETPEGRQCRFTVHYATTTEEMVALLQERKPTGLILTNDEPGPELVRLLPQYGIRVPQDLSIVNFNSTEDCARAVVPLTSVWQPLHDIGLSGMRQVVRVLSGEVTDTTVLRFPVRLDVRASSAPPFFLP